MLPLESFRAALGACHYVNHLPLLRRPHREEVADRALGRFRRRRWRRRAGRGRRVARRGGDTGRCFRRAAGATATRTDPFHRAFADRVFDRVGVFHQLVLLDNPAMAFAFFAAAIIAALIRASTLIAAPALAALRTRRAVLRNALLFALAAVTILGLFLGRAIGVTDGNQPFVTAALGAAAARIAARRGAAGWLGVATGFGRRRGDRGRQRGDGQSHELSSPFHD
jgi:hypothetical protein